MTTEGDRYFRCAPHSARTRTVWYFLGLYGTLSVIGIVSFLGSTPEPISVPVSVGLGVFVCWGTVRSARVQWVVDRDSIVISNQFRTYVLEWSEIDKVELSTLPGYLGSYVPALAFHRRSGWRVKAQAVANRQYEQEAMLNDLRSVTPAEVVVDMDVDGHRPRPTVRLR